MYKVVVSKPAEDDLLSAVNYIAKELKNPVAAVNLLEKAAEVLNSLSNFPLRHSLLEDEYLSQLGIRMMQIDNYLAFYIVHEKDQIVSIIRFLYARRDWMSILKGK